MWRSRLAENWRAKWNFYIGRAAWRSLAILLPKLSPFLPSWIFFPGMTGCSCVTSCRGAVGGWELVADGQLLLVVAQKG